MNETVTTPANHAHAALGTAPGADGAATEQVR